MNNLRKKRICLVILAVAVFLTGLSGCGQAAKEEAAPTQTEKSAMAAQPQRQVREGIQTILILCLDNYEAASSSDAFRNTNRADFAMLMVMDQQLGRITSLQLNPDTVVPFEIPGKSETVEIPLGQVYSYGSGGSDSCLHMTKAVSRLLGGIRVDHYLTFTMDSVGIVNDMIGGVEIPATADTEGEAEAAVKLSGAEAAEFFSRRDPEDVSNQDHMERQRQYMAAMYAPFMVSAQNEDFLTRLSLQLGEKMATGLTLSQLIQMFETMAAYTMDENILMIPGEASKVDGEIRFHVDEAALDRTVESVFFN